MHKLLPVLEMLQFEIGHTQNEMHIIFSYCNIYRCIVVKYILIEQKEHTYYTCEMKNVFQSQ